MDIKVSSALLPSQYKVSDRSVESSQSSSETSKGELSDSTPNISSYSQQLLEDFDQTVETIQKEIMTPYTGPVDGHHSPSVYIDIGRYNLHLADKAVGSLQEKYGSSLDADELKTQLIQATGMVTENPLKGAQREASLPDNLLYGRLKEKDVQSLTDIYIYSKENGIDVDSEQLGALAFYMGSYRSDQARGGSYFPVLDPVDPALEQQAKAIFSGSDSPVTQLDKGFLDDVLNPDKRLRSFSKAVDLDFLEKITGTGSGDEAFLSTKQFILGSSKTGEQQVGAEENRELSPEEMRQKELKNWLETYFKADSPMIDLIASIPVEEQPKLLAQLNGLKLL